MSIRPVDILAPLQSSPDITRNTQNDNNRPHVSNQQFAEQLQKEVRLSDQQVVQSNHSEGRTVDKDGKGNTGSGQSKSKSRHNRNEEEKKKKSQSTSMFDVSI